MPDKGGPIIADRRRVAWFAAALAFAAAWLTGCTGINVGDVLSSSPPPPSPLPPVAGAPPLGDPVGSIGGVKVALILPLTAAGNAGAAGLAMRNAGEMALAEFNGPNVQLIVKDDGGTSVGAQQAAQQAIDEGAEIILGPLFAHSVNAAKPIVRARGVPMIAFSTDTNVAGAGVYLLSFLPESDVDRVVSYAVSQNRRSFIAMLPTNAYGTVVEGEFKQAVARRGGRVMALEHYPDDRNRMGDAARLVAQAASRADALFIADGGDAVTDVVLALANAGVNLRQFAMLGTQLWEDPKIFASPQLAGGWYPAPDPAGFRGFADRYRGRYHHDPPRPAALAYDAVALIAALVKTQGPNRFSAEVLTNPSGFAGIDGVFRLRPDGTNQRGLAILRVTPGGGQVVSPASRTFSGAAGQESRAL